MFEKKKRPVSEYKPILIFVLYKITFARFSQLKYWLNVKNGIRFIRQEISTLYQFPSTSNENFFKVTGAECFAFFFIPVTLNES